MSNAGIGVFDSGIGGLTVAGALARRLPGETLIYMGDTARLPYGTKSPDVVRRYAERCSRFLLEQDIKLLVIACNTASAHALEHLQQTLPVPVLGVIGPGASAGLKASKQGRVGVIGTAGTVRSGAYRRAILALDPNASVVEKACPLFVPLAEEGLTDHPATELIARDYLAELANVDALVLGCTHYPVLRNVIARVLGPGVTLCDSADATADEVQRAIAAMPATRPAAHRFYLTDVQPQFQQLAARFFGGPVAAAERVDL